MEKDFGGWISLLFHKLRKRVNAEVQTLGLTGIQSHALHYILVKSEEGPVYQRDVEGVFGVSRSTVTGMLQQMERDGLIRRDSVEGDGRLKCLIPTQKAIEMDERVRKCLKRVDAGADSLAARRLQRSCRANGGQSGRVNARSLDGQGAPQGHDRRRKVSHG